MAETFVLDASVATKWHLEDEEGREAARLLLQRFVDGEINLFAPDHIRYEVASAITRASRRPERLAPDRARRALQLFLSWSIATVGDDDLIVNGFALARDLGCSLYDGLYLALAERLEMPLITADRRLKELGNGRVSVILLEDVRPTTGGA